MDFNKRIFKNKKYNCPRCQWPLENLFSRYVSREGDFQFFHCINCGQDYYMEFRELLDSDKDETDSVMLKRIEMELEYILKPLKYWEKKNKPVKCNLN